MRILLFLAVFAFGFASCGSDSTANAESVDQAKTAPEITSNEVNNNVTADEPTDTVNVAKMAFTESSFDFGSVVDGEVVNHVYKFKNTGKVPLVISNAKSTCGCTVPDWPRDPIPPGEGGEIKVEFKTKGKTRNGKESKQTKPVTITANTYPKNTVIHISGTVLPDPNAPAPTAQTAPTGTVVPTQK